jgi:hypothetical protein
VNPCVAAKVAEDDNHHAQAQDGTLEITRLCLSETSRVVASSCMFANPNAFGC